MKNYGIEVAEGSVVSNLSVPVGSAFPSTPNEGELFFKTTDQNLYVYKNTGWGILQATAAGYLELTGGTLTGDLRVDSDVGINRAPRVSLDVGGTVLVQPTTAADALITLKHGSANPVVGLKADSSGVLSLFTNDNVVALTINTSGVATFASTPYVNGFKIWHENNDGSSSGLDADLLDGQESSYYLDWTNVTNKPDPVITLTGDITGSGTLTNLGNVSITTTLASTASNKIFYGNSKVEIPTPNGAIISTTNGIERMKIAANGAVDIKYVAFLGGSQTTSQVGTVLTTPTYVEDFGGAITISADAQTLVVGAPGYAGDNVTDGRVAVYDWSGTNWTQRGSWLENFDAATDVKFGSSVALSGDGNYMYVGAEYWDDNINPPVRGGRVYMYQRNVNTWNHVTSLYGTVAENHFGSGVAVSSSNTVLAVGAKGHSTPNDDQGCVHIYDWSGSAWVQRGSPLVAPDAATYDRFGWDVSLSTNGNILAVRAFSGTYIFEWSGSVWNLKGSKITHGGNTGVNSCAISGDGSTVVFGGPLDATGGRVYVYDWSGSAWVQRENFQAPDAQTGFGFGASVALSSDESILVVGASGWNIDYPTRIGGVYTFALQGNGNYGIPDTASDRTLVGYNSLISHSFTAETEANTFFTIGKNDTSTGGVEFRGFTETDDAVAITGYSTTPNTSSSTPGIIRANAKKLAGLFGGTAANNENLFTVENNGVVKFLVKGNGDIVSSGSITATSVSGSASSLSTPRNISATGDASWTVSFDGSSNVSAALTLASTGISAGTYNNSTTQITPLTLDVKGRVTNTGTPVTITPDWTSIQNTPTTLSGYGITDAASVSGTTYVGTTSVGLNRASANQALTGILSVAMPGATSGTITIQPASVAGTNTITFPAVTGNVITTGDTATVTNTMLAGSISNDKLVNSSITIGSTNVSLGGTASSVTGLSTINGLSLTANATGFSIAGGTTSKTLTVQNTLTFQGTDASSVNFSAGGTVAYTDGNLSQFASTTSSQLASIISDETGTGALVFGTSPAITTSLTTPSTTFNLLNATATTINFGGAATSLNIGASTGTTLVNNNLSVVGNLIINGTTTTVNSTVVSIDDPVFTLGGDTAPTSDDNKDRGIEFRWHNGTSAKVGFFGFDDSTGKLTFIPDATNTSEVFSGTKGTIDAYLDWANLTNIPSPTITLSGAISGSGTLDPNGGITITTTGSGLTSNRIYNGTSEVVILASGGHVKSVVGGVDVFRVDSGYVSFNDTGYIRSDNANRLTLQNGSQGTVIRNNSNSATLLTVVEPSGNVLIGTTTDDGANKLQVNGSASIQGQTLTLGGTGFNGVINNAASIRINIDSDNNNAGESFTIGHNQTGIDNNNVLFRVQDNGNVLIGTTTDSGRKLQVYGVGEFKDVSGIATTIWSEAVSGTGGIGTNSNHPFAILTNGVERVRVNTAGTINVSNALDGTYNANIIIDSAVATAKIAFNPSGSFSSGIGGGNGILQFFANGANTERMRVASSGNLLIGTTTDNGSDKLQVAGSVNISSSLRVGDSLIQTASLTTSTTTANQVVTSFAAASFRSAKFQVQVTSGTSYHVTEIMVMHDGTTPYINEYGTMFTGSSLATFDADVNTGSVRLLVTPTNAVTTIKVTMTLIAV